MTDEIVVKGPGRPPHVPTDASRKTVKAMVSYGIPQEDIGKVIGVSHDTLNNYYRHEIDTATAEANSMVAQRLYQKCMNDDTASILFWLKTRARWAETQKIEHTGEGGKPIQNNLTVEYVRPIKDTNT